MIFGEAEDHEVPAIAALLRDDKLGQGRESEDMAPYRAAFHQITSDANNALVVGRLGARVAACYQLTFIPGFTLNATRRAEIEGVRVASDLRGQGYGALLLADAEARARKGGATLLQLAMNATRDDTRRFYEANGYDPSHIGFKKWL